MRITPTPIFLDSSTTANYIAEKLTNYRLTVLTNSIQIINTLASFSGISLIMVGGNFDKKSQSFYGTRALEFVRSMWTRRSSPAVRLTINPA